MWLLFSHSVVSNSFASLWAIARQAPLSMGFSRQEFWSGLPLPSPGDLSNPGIKPVSPGPPTLQVNSFLVSHLVGIWFYFFSKMSQLSLPHLLNTPSFPNWLIELFLIICCIFLYAIDCWTTQVWTAQFHLYMQIIFSKYVLHYLWSLVGCIH